MNKIQSSSVGMGEPYRRPDQSGLHGKSRSSLKITCLHVCQKAHNGTFAEKHPNGSLTLRNQILRSDETKMEVFSQRSQWCVCGGNQALSITALIPMNPCSQTQRRQQHAVGMFFCHRDWETSQVRSVQDESENLKGSVHFPHAL